MKNLWKVHFILLVIIFLPAFGLASSEENRIYSNKYYNYSFKYSQELEVIDADNIDDILNSDEVNSEIKYSLDSMSNKMKLALVIDKTGKYMNNIIVQEISEVIKNHGLNSLQEYLLVQNNTAKEQKANYTESEVLIGDSNISGIRYIRHPKSSSKEVHNVYFNFKDKIFNIALVVDPTKEVIFLDTYNIILQSFSDAK